MSDNINNIGNMFKEVLTDFEQEMPARVWDNVSTAIKKEKRRKIIIFYWSLAASLALIIAFGSGYFYASYQREQKYSAIFYKDLNRKLLLRNRDLYAINNNPIFSENKNYKTTIKNHSTHTSPPDELVNITAGLTNNDKILIQDSNIIENDIISNYYPEPFLLNNNDDTIVIRNIVIDLKQNPEKTVDIQVGNQYIIPVTENDKKEVTDKSSGKWTFAQQNSPVYNLGSIGKMEMSSPITYGYANTPSNQSTQTIKEKKVLVLYAAGISSMYQFRQKWGARCGLFYAVGQLYNGFQRQQFEIPITIAYNLYNKNFRWDISSGLGTNIIISHNSSNTFYSALLGTTLGYNISRKIAINFEPTIKYNFPYPRTYLVNRYPFSIAFYTGLSYNL